MAELQTLYVCLQILYLCIYMYHNLNQTLQRESTKSYQPNKSTLNECSPLGAELEPFGINLKNYKHNQHLLR